MSTTSITKILWLLSIQILISTSCSTLPSQTPILSTTEDLSPQNTPVKVTPTKNPAGKTNFESLLGLFADECKAPCFLLIKPELTPFEDAEIILTEDLNFSCSRLSPPSLPNKIYLNCSLGQYNSYLIVRPNPQTGMVDWLTYSSASSIQALRLEDIIELFGIPDASYISALPDDTGLSWVSFYYDSLQVSVHLGETNEISADSEVYVIFMGENRYLEEKVLEERTSTQQAWEGYKKLP